MYLIENQSVIAYSKLHKCFFRDAKVRLLFDDGYVQVALSNGYDTIEVRKEYVWPVLNYKRRNELTEMAVENLKAVYDTIMQIPYEEWADYFEIKV